MGKKLLVLLTDANASAVCSLQFAGSVTRLVWGRKNLSCACGWAGNWPACNQPQPLRPQRQLAVWWWIAAPLYATFHYEAANYINKWVCVCVCVGVGVYIYICVCVYMNEAVAYLWMNCAASAADKWSNFSAFLSLSLSAPSLSSIFVLKMEIEFYFGRLCWDMHKTFVMCGEAQKVKMQHQHICLSALHLSCIQRAQNNKGYIDYSMKPVTLIEEIVSRAALLLRQLCWTSWKSNYF